ncbi:MAG: epoxyqueuosine reductase [Methanomassiliicoccus sp.]|nr:epoxyqueuosine reductase [Methanomassiliicoccus sp.]
MEGVGERLARKCEQLDIPLLGIAPAERWESLPFHPWVPPEFRPRGIYPEARSVVVIGLPVELPVLETTPSIYYHELYNTVNRLLDDSAYRIATMLSELGWPSIFVPRDGYGSLDVLKDRPTAFFSHRHAAYLAGLGTFGVNNMLLTPRYGPRVRFTSILTTAQLPYDQIMEGDVCVRCMRCVRSCPARALEEGSYPETLTKKDRCTTYNLNLAEDHISPCGVCIKVCPVGEDREQYGRKDARMYDDPERFAEHHRAWEHVRAYSGRPGKNYDRGSDEVA